MKYQIYLRGIEAFEDQANKLIKDVTEGKTKLLLSQAKVVQAAIKSRSPLGPTGNLRRSSYAKAMPETMIYPTVAFAGIRPRRAPHAHLVEFGHGGPHPAPAHPFVKPAWESVKDFVRENIRLGIKNVIERR